MGSRGRGRWHKSTEPVGTERFSTGRIAAARFGDDVQHRAEHRVANRQNVQQPGDHRVERSHVETPLVFQVPLVTPGIVTETYCQVFAALIVYVAT